MIRDHDRSGWIGASDTSYVVGNWSTKSWADWWAVKLGVREQNLETIYTRTGSHYEGKILDALGVKQRDRQIRIPELRLRVNLDGETNIIHEVKTHKHPEFRVSKDYWRQAQAEMFAARKPLNIVSYRLVAEDYENWLNPIDRERLGFHPVVYDEAWIWEEYLPKLRILAECLKKGVYPR